MIHIKSLSLLSKQTDTLYMAETLYNQQRRLLAIDRCLRSGLAYRIKGELDQRCNRILEEDGIRSYSWRQYYNDINFLEIHYSAPIERANGRVRYSDRKYSIIQMPMDENEWRDYEEMLAMLRRFCNESHNALTFDLRDRMKQWLGDYETEGKVVSFERVDNYEGAVWFDKLFACISRRQVIDLWYKPFYQEAVLATVSPYHLKQYNGRWFLIASMEDGRGGLIRHYALDRIEDIKENAKAVFRSTNIDFGEYFFPVIGVTIPEDGETQTITLRVRKKEYPYVETKPLHITQEKMCEDEDSVTITIEVMVNFELKQRLLSHADYVTVIAPQSLREEMKSLIENMWKNYAD